MTVDRTTFPNPASVWSADRAVPRVAWRWIASAAVVLLGLALSLWVTLFVFERIPHNEDELAYVFQAKVFYGGALSAPAPPVSGLFFAPFVVERDGQRFGKYPPGFALVLAPGAALGLHWLVNPLLGAASLALIVAIGARYFSLKAGLLAALLGALSPFFLEYAGSLMSHTASLCVLMLALWFYADAWVRRNRSAALLCGLLFGLAFLMRPVTAVGVGLPFALHAAWLCVRGRTSNFGFPVALGALPGIVALPLFNFAVSGEVRLSLYDLWWSFDHYGFGEGIGTLKRHTLALGVRYLDLNWHIAAPILQGWPLVGYGALVLFVFEALAVVWLLASWRRGERPRPLVLEALLIASVVTLVVAYVPYWAPHPRYYYESLGGFLLISALGAFRLSGLIPQFARLKAPFALAAGILLTYGMLTSTPAYLWTLHHKNHFTRERLDTVEQAHLTNALVLVQQDGDWSDYGSVFPANSPWLDGDVVYALYGRESDVARLRRALPGRQVYVLRGTNLRRL